MSDTLFETPPVEAKPARKAAKKVAAKKSDTITDPSPVMAATVAAPAAKKVAKKVVAKAPIAEAPAPSVAEVAPAAPAKKSTKKAATLEAASAPAPAVAAPSTVLDTTDPKAPAKKAARKAVRVNAEGETAEPASKPAQAAPAPAPLLAEAPAGEKALFRQYPRQERKPYPPRTPIESNHGNGGNNGRDANDGRKEISDAPNSSDFQGSATNPGPAEGPQGERHEGGGKKFRKSWKQRKYEKYLKRKAEREARMRGEGIDPATAPPRPPHPQQQNQPRPQHPNQPQHPKHQHPRHQRDQERFSREPRDSRDPREARESMDNEWEDRRPDPNSGPPLPTAGILEISPKGFGFIRLKEKNYAQSPTDTFVTPEMVRKYGLRDGVWMEGDFLNGNRGPQMTELKAVNGLPPDHYRQLPIFEELTAINPNKRYTLETEEGRNTMRLVDMIAPIGRGQRGLIVAAPRAGKTTFLEHMAQAILKNYAGTKLLVLLVDERPEEVTELTRALPGAEIMASSNDADPRAHIRMAQLAIERAKRLVEAGEHVFMLMDSITRLARAFNQAIKGGGKAMSGGIDARALEMPRKIFAAARNTREAGSLTIIATALIETNNKGDDLIFQEFKGTGNMELVLDRKIAQQYVYPAVDIFKSGTRREELLLPPYQLEKINVIRRGLAGHKPIEAIERLIHFLNRFKNNNELLMNIATKNG